MEHIRPLNALRFVAAFLIFLSHLDYFMNIPAAATFFETYMFHGFSGVTIFFVLSGFLLTYRYYPVFLKRLTRESYLSYYWKRVNRMYPIHILTLLAAILVLPMGRWTLPELLSNIFLVQAFIPVKTFYFGFNDVSWFLSALFFCYLVFPILLLTITKFHQKLAHSTAILGLSVIAYALFYFVTNAHTPNVHWTFYISPYLRLIEFLVGVFFGIVYFLLPHQANRIVQRDSIYEAIVLLLFAYFFTQAHTIDLRIRYSLYWIPISGLIVFVFSRTRGIFARMLSSEVFQWLGSLSFAFMMIHHIIIRYVESFYIAEIQQKPFSATVFLFLASLLVTILYQKAEKWVRSKKVMPAR